jgi:uncharacterized protein YbjT (DUF2867 family)
MVAHRVFITGGTGLMGRHLIPELLRRGYEVRALVRPGSAARLPPSCEAVEGDALDAGTYAHRIAPADTFVHLVGVSHPNPSKAGQFRSVDLKSAQEAITAARGAGVSHFVYLSVAQPAPVMKAYIEARSAGEALLPASGMNATILRPWYVLGPRRRWPLVLLPMYWLFEFLPPTREAARRLGLVSLEQMVAALRGAVENPPEGVRVVEVPGIRESVTREYRPRA